MVSTKIHLEIFSGGKDVWKQRLFGVQNCLDSDPYDALASFERKLQREYNDVLHQEELLWYQKSRENWVKHGDRNTRLFHHALRAVWKKRNHIHGPFLDSGEWCTDDKIL